MRNVAQSGSVDSEPVSKLSVARSGGPEGEALESRYPRNPFATRAYANAMESLGFEAWVFGEVCAGFLRRGRLNASLELPSFPALPDPAMLPNMLREFCREGRLSSVEINTYASPPVVIPQIFDREFRTARQEFSITLDTDLYAGIGSNHRRNIKKAVQAGITIAVRSGADACATHVRLMGNSMTRRTRRGETIEVQQEAQVRETNAFTTSGAGFLAQAAAGADILSSILILRSSKGAYYHSAGTSPEGMEKGASQLLVYDLLQRMKAEGCEVFYLGGAEAGTGLERFKAGFGAKPVALERVNADLQGFVRKRLSNLVQTLRSQ